MVIFAKRVLRLFIIEMQIFLQHLDLKLLTKKKPFQNSPQIDATFFFFFTKFRLKSSILKHEHRKKNYELKNSKMLVTFEKGKYWKNWKGKILTRVIEVNFKVISKMKNKQYTCTVAKLIVHKLPIYYFRKLHFSEIWDKWGGKPDYCFSSEISKTIACQWPLKFFCLILYKTTSFICLILRSFTSFLTHLHASHSRCMTNHGNPTTNWAVRWLNIQVPDFDGCVHRTTD